MTPEPTRTAWAARIEAELRGNILPFWMAHTVDRVNGGFYGALSDDLRVDNEVERSSVLCARILWTYATAYRLYGDDAYLQMARHAYDYLTGPFLDMQHGGVYWSVDCCGKPLLNRKHTYAQAYGVYALSEYYRATGDQAPLHLAQQLYGLIEEQAYDTANGGYVECLDRGWGPLDDMRLSAVDVNARKSMNTTLHLIEAYANLLRVWDDAGLRAKLGELIGVFFDHVVDADTHHLRLYFDDAWNWRHLSETISYGHDIEASWLLLEAAEVLGDAGLVARARDEAVAMADRVYHEAMEADGSLLYESEPAGGHGARATQKHWWPHAEAVIGFYNAYQISGQVYFARAATACWRYIEARFVDRGHGDWFKVLDRFGTPIPGQVKVGPWECPYHHSRMCFEMLARLREA